MSLSGSPLFTICEWSCLPCCYASELVQAFERPASATLSANNRPSSSIFLHRESAFKQEGLPSAPRSACTAPKDHAHYAAAAAHPVHEFTVSRHERLRLKSPAILHKRPPGCPEPSQIPKGHHSRDLARPFQCGACNMYTST